MDDSTQRVDTPSPAGGQFRVLSAMDLPSPIGRPSGSACVFSKCITLPCNSFKLCGDASGTQYDWRQEMPWLPASILAPSPYPKDR